jgi:methylaspartate ammonia-lyase
VTRIARVLAVPAVGAYYYEDLAALQANPTPVAERYTAAPVTPGFRRVREVAEAASVGLVLDDDSVAWGDCVAVAYSGKAGRDPVFRAEEGLATIRRTVAPALQGAASSWRPRLVCGERPKGEGRRKGPFPRSGSLWNARCTLPSATGSASLC